MHEYAIVENIVTNVVRHLGEAGIEKVLEVHLRRGSTFSQEALEQAYTVTTAGTPLQAAKLHIHTTITHFQCGCGYEQDLVCDDVIAHMFICPRCSAVHEIDEHHDLELLEIIVDEPTTEPTVL
jgi:Zn finger protein HypA/HybF involved in hydrogenase expression